MFSFLSKNKKENNKKGFLGMNAKEHKKFMNKVIDKASQDQLEILRKADMIEKTPRN